MTRHISCLVADDHPAVVEAVGAALAANGIDVVGRASDDEEALELIRRLAPSVALVDLRLPHLGGIELARRSARSSPGTGVILSAASNERMLLSEALAAGARGFVFTDARVSELVRAVEAVAHGGMYIDPTLVGAMLSAPRTGASPALTQRELDVLRLLAEGYSNEEIGNRLSISPETVRSHAGNAARKLSARNRTQAVAIALRQSLIS